MDPYSILQMETYPDDGYWEAYGGRNDPDRDWYRDFDDVLQMLDPDEITWDAYGGCKCLVEAREERSHSPSL